MIWDYIEGNLDEFKGHDKQQDQNPQKYNSDLIVINKLKHENQSLTTINVIETRAERQLCELNELLQIMESFRNKISITSNKRLVDTDGR
jgi:hypothetical protein